MFKYCPQCKSEISKKHIHYWCKTCGFDYYANPAIGAAVILLNNKNQIFLGKREHEPRAGFWETPGGFVDIKERAEDAVKREIKEELNVDVTEMKYFCSYPNSYYFKGTQYYPLDLFFIAKTDQNHSSVNLNEEFSEGRFFNLKEIPFEELAFESQKRALDDYIKLERK